MTNCAYCEQKCGFNCQTTIEQFRVLDYGQTEELQQEIVFVCDVACSNAMMREMRNPGIEGSIDVYGTLKKQFDTNITELKAGFKRFKTVPKEIVDASPDYVWAKKNFPSIMKENFTYLVTINRVIDFLNALLARSPDTMLLYQQSKKMVHECMVYERFINFWSKVHRVYFKDAPKELFSPWL